MKVEDTVFKVVRSHFEDYSPYFKGLFALSDGETGRTTETGVAPETPLKLDGVTKIDFMNYRAFLAAGYIFQLLPALGHWIMGKVGPKRVAQYRTGGGGYDLGSMLKRKS